VLEQRLVQVPSRAPAPTEAIPSLTSTRLIGVTSMTIPSVTERPATEWPPHRIDTGSPARRANPIAAGASAGVRHLTTAAGLTSWNRAIAGLRTTS
jgi:hypothetical protein